MVFRELDAAHLVLLAGIGILAVGRIRSLRSAEGDRLSIGTIGWLVLSVYWAIVGIERIWDGFAFLGFTASIVGILCLYASVLCYREHEVIPRLSQAFVVMGAVYIPFEYVEPVHQLGLEIVTRHTALVTGYVGTETTVVVGPEGYENVLQFPDPTGGGILTASIISACTGISAIAFFTGLVSISNTSRRIKIQVLLVLTLTIYLLNIVRNVFTATTYANHSFSPLANVEFIASGARSDPHFSYFIAEQLIGPVYILVGTVVVYYCLIRVMPGIHETFHELLDAVERDIQMVRR